MNELQSGRVLAVDWGARRIGLALSDPTRTLARPLTILTHVSRKEDARRIVEIANESDAETIIMGVTYSSHDKLSPSGRSAQRLAVEIEKQSAMRVVLWDEDFTSRDVMQQMIESGKPRATRGKPSDDKAAALLLQNYLDSEQNEK